MLKLEAFLLHFLFSSWYSNWICSHYQSFPSSVGSNKLCSAELDWKKAQLLFISAVASRTPFDAASRSASGRDVRLLRDKNITSDKWARVDGKNGVGFIENGPLTGQTRITPHFNEQHQIPSVTYRCWGFKPLLSAASKTFPRGDQWIITILIREKNQRKSNNKSSRH